MHGLILKSGVSGRNDNDVGVFSDAKTAHLIAELLMALDRCQQPEYASYEVTEVPIG